MKKTGIVIIGGGAAGLAAGLEACCGPFETLLLEKNNICGKKLLLTGGGRCNFSHAGTTRELVSAFHGQGKFLFSALSQFDSTHYIDFLSRAGVPVKLESDGRYFPRSDKAVAVRDAFLRALNKAGCQPLYNCNVNRISRLSEQNKFAITAQTSQTSETFIADAVILATGAPCYPETGSDGWGLPWQLHLV